MGYTENMGEGRNAYNILVRKREGKRPPQSTRHRWKDDIKMYFKNLECEGELN